MKNELKAVIETNKGTINLRASPNKCVGFSGGRSGRPLIPPPDSSRLMSIYSSLSLPSYVITLFNRSLSSHSLLVTLSK
jgi:hypothetical protein